jgi:hypothetical protein
MLLKWWNEPIFGKYTNGRLAIVCIGLLIGRLLVYFVC